jgi:hypothetical protein
MKARVKLMAAALCVLCGAATAFGQTSGQGSVFIRNVLVADGEGERMVRADVLVTRGRLVRVADNSTAPAGAIVIDGGGSTLKLDADGGIKLSPVGGSALDSQRPMLRATSLTLAPAADEKTTHGDASPVSGRGAANHDGLAQVQPPDAQDGAQQAGKSAEDNLAAAVVDPTAALKTISFQNKFSPSLWGVDDEQNEIDLQLGIPHSAFGQRNILRVTTPYTTSSAAGTRGVGDVSVFNILLFPKKWGTLAVGAVASLGTNKGPGIDTFALGPAVGLVLKKGKWTYGVFSQNLFSLGDIATTQVQPILAYTVNKHVSLALGDTQYTVDWNKGRFVNVPFGVQVNYITHFGEQPVRLFVNPLYNMKNEFGSKKWTITTGLAFIVR